ncbi:hypothetical protein Nepgr_030339 [Nepenthes gracilis]|uniref:Uncharacterized protein n=1 Tax=Nepenthes gracilis TaxID=150966 RepID=A0AAD3TG15_NEPGR|nr:hypothetical protein Nepgr_030339 [Nepenthes gracilis]
MASRLGSAVRAAVTPPREIFHLLIQAPKGHFATPRSRRRCQIRASNGSGSDSHLGIWKNAVDRQRKEIEFHSIAENSAVIDEENEESPEALERKTNEFKKILEVPKEERDKAQQMQVIDRADAAIAAARAILKENPPPAKMVSDDPSASPVGNLSARNDAGTPSWSSSSSHSRSSGNGTPGPDFWSWIPPPEDDSSFNDARNLQKSPETSKNPNPQSSVIEKDRPPEFISIPFEIENSGCKTNPPAMKEDLGVNFPSQAAEAADALDNAEEEASCGIHPDGSRWWKEMGVERRPNGEVCRWTLTRGVSADAVVEWEDKYWEAADQFGYKELGSEKSGRDATGNVWHEYWKESMWQEGGLLQMEKTADKWGKNGKGEEWQEKWWEHYDAAGRADKWAHKCCSINPSTLLEAGHAHVWHERWGEKYDGLGGSTKYTDKWAERCEGDGWAKWGDKWDEHFDLNGHGVKQGETWWEGEHGDRWNRTWGEQHNAERRYRTIRHIVTC